MKVSLAVVVALLPLMTSSTFRPTACHPISIPLSTDQPDDSSSICLDDIRAGVCHLCMHPSSRPARRSSSRSLPH